MSQTWQTIEQAAVSLRLSVRTVNRHIAAGKLESRLNEGRREVLVDVPEVPAVEAPAAPFSFDANVSAASAAVTDTDATAGNIGGSDEAPTAAQPATATTTTTTSPFSQAPSPPVSVDPETVLALADNAAQKAELAVAAYQTLARQADGQMLQIRRTARFAWAAVAVMAVGVTGAVGWTTHRLTRASAERDHLQDQWLTSKDEARRLSTVADTLRTEHTESERQLRTEFATRQEQLITERATAEQALRTELSDARQSAARAEGQLAAYKEQEAAREQREAMVAAAAAAAPIASTPRDRSASIVPPTLTLDTNGGSAIAASARESGSSDATATESATPTTQPAPARTNVAPTSRPVTLRRRAAAPTTRPAPAPDTTTSASTAEDRPLR